MSSSKRYRPSNTDHTSSDDSDSDLDLDLQELDPASSSQHVLRQARPTDQAQQGVRNEYRARQERNGHIPLRNWRPSSLRAQNRMRRGYGELGKRKEEEDEDADGLLLDNYGADDGLRDSMGELPNSEDDAPLLPQGAEKQRLSGERKGRMSRLGSKLSLPRLRPAESRGADHSEDVPQEPEADHDPESMRTVFVGQPQLARYPLNAVSNAKYTSWSFLPRTLYNEFSFFFNMYFLLVALSQIIPPLRIGYLSTYIVPLAFVLIITLGKEALDDIARRRRDAEANSELYTVLHFPHRRERSSPKRKDTGAETLPGAVANEIMKKARDLKVGDILKLKKDHRIPADVIILKSYSNEKSLVAPGRSDLDIDQATKSPNLVDPVTSASPGSTSLEEDRNRTPIESGSEDLSNSVGETFIRTDQLDGETDWKLRLASPISQSLDNNSLGSLEIVAGKPERKVNEFIGTIQVGSRSTHNPDFVRAEPPIGEDEQTTIDETASRSSSISAPLTIDNTAWANTVLASNSIVLAAVVYTGPETRQALSTSASRSKTGLLEYEINSLTKILCLLTFTLSVILVVLQRFESEQSRKWYITIMRFLILFSTIIPISLRVNLDMGKSVYAWFIERDQDIKGAIVRTSTIPEDLGRVEYLLSDKTGTLTQNEMEMKKIHVGTVSYANEAMEEVSSYVRQAFSSQSSDVNQATDLVTPSSTYTLTSNSANATRARREIGLRVRDVVLALAICHNVTPTSEEEDGKSVTTYQASSPDEIAIVRWTDSVGLRLLHRDRKSMVLQSTHSNRVVVRVRILDVFPFTSDGKRMGIVVQFITGRESSEAASDPVDEIWFYQKGADTVMSTIVAANDWLDEETANMAREGLRTLVVGRKKISKQQYTEFASQYREASLALHGREASMSRVVKSFLESDLELLGVTGVEDKLQRDVKPSLELLRNAGVKIWMLTGDKVETARCVAVSAKLVARGQYVHTITKLKRKDLAQDSLDFLRSKTDACLLIDGESLALLLQHYREEFISLAVLLPAVIACRCSPTQKADVAKLIRSYTKKRICCIGDGGNDVSMIQAADVGVGIVGKEGRQASLSADFSIDQFCHLTKLLVWHGRNSYKRSAKLAQFVIHRGLIISVCQTMFSIASRFEPIALYKDWLLVGYATVYTMAPVFSLVLDKDVDEKLANLYPELYKELTTGRSLSYRTFFVWVLVSIYQGGIIQGLSQILVEVNGPRMVSVSFTVLVINELVMVAFEITTWHPVMIFSLLGTALVYFGSIPFLGRYFDLAYVVSWGFVWRVAAISAISLIPPYAAKLLRRTLKPPSYRKVQGL
ncbi:MAG: putative aminophospholipid-translocase [Chaenotheca gracillima]|nr:MAG: putative aminophospholipid-translocase [Chaenotheca gracillima]